MILALVRNAGNAASNTSIVLPIVTMARLKAYWSNIQKISSNDKK